MVVQLFLYHLLDVTEVYYHSVRIQLFGTAIDSDNPVVTVQILTLTAIRKFQAMGSRHFHTFDDCVHIVNTLINIISCRI